jgi:GTP-binding protein HflX
VGDRRLNALFELINDIDKSIDDVAESNQQDKERAILVGLETSPGKKINGKTEGERLLEELGELASTAGVEVVQKVLQRKQSKDSAFFVGKGMVEQLSLLRQALDVDVLIFDDELSGAQVRNIEEVTGAKVIDRATLILDIFAQRARSKEGKIQVELAQLKYRLPRLIGLGNQLSRLGGGIGTRGPGEKKLEVDRRHIKRRIKSLETELEALGKRRELMREGRRKNSVPTVALVGYTNVGKSTLLNKLCDSDVFAENKLFATLDPTIRNLSLPDGREALLIDTVGFIRKLPHDLVEAFKSTLEEAVFADVLLHVVDVSSEDAEMQINVVDSILEELGAINKPTVFIFNKTDLVDSEDGIPLLTPGCVHFEVSAVTGKGLHELKKGIAEILPISEVEVEMEVPYSEGWVIPYLHQNGKILSEEFTENHTKLKAVINKKNIDKLKEFIK